MAIKTNIGVFTEVMPLIFIHWFGYMVASMVLLALCGIFFRGNSTIFSFNIITTNAVDGALLIVALASIAGIPPFFGFWTKTAILMFVGRFGASWVIAACWSIAVIALLFYINAVRYSFSLRAAIAAETPAAVMRRPSMLIVLLGISLIVGVLFLGDASLAAQLIFA